MKLLTVFLFSLGVFSCGTSTKTTTNENINTTETTTSETTMSDKEMIAEGYQQGVMVYSDKEGDCPYTVQMKGDKMEFYYLDPTNLKDSFKKDSLKIWLKFNGLRIMNRCDKATPIEVIEMKKREE